MHHVFTPANDVNQRVKLSDDLVTTVNEQGLGSLASDIADMTDGMSGREIEKMCSNIYVSIFFFYSKSEITDIKSFLHSSVSMH